MTRSPTRLERRWDGAGIGVVVRLLFAMLLLLGGAGCGGGVIQKVGELPPPPPNQAFVQLTAEPADVDVYLDGRFAGRLDGYPDGVIRVSPGVRRVTLKRRGYYSAYAELEAQNGRLAAWAVRLVPEVP
jgi:hypothetical protein